MKKPVRWIVVASSLALAGCSSDVSELREVIAPIICKAGDSDGRIYEATNIEPVNAERGIVSMRTRGARSDDLSRSRVRSAPVNSHRFRRRGILRGV